MNNINRIILCKASHKVSKLKYHFVICIKYRKDLFLNKNCINTLRKICEGLQERYHLKFETIGFDEDHIHFMLQSLTTTYPPAKIFQVIKSITAIKMFEFHNEIREELWGGEFWSDGGYVATVGEGVNADITNEYIRRQGRKGEKLKLYEFT